MCPSGVREPDPGGRDQPHAAEDAVGPVGGDAGVGGYGEWEDLPSPPPFIVVATQNPIEQEGTYPLPEASLTGSCSASRWITPRARRVVHRRPANPQQGEQPSPLAKREEFQRFNEIIDQTPISQHVLEQAVAITTASRPKDPTADDYVRKYVAWGAGPGQRSIWSPRPKRPLCWMGDRRPRLAI